MRTSNKSRSRKNNRNRNNVGNVINRVFDSSGPEGRVRGTPNQIIEKYQTLARDATLAGDRVAAENFQQHAEHYIRILAAAQAEVAREQEKRQAEYEARQAKRRDEQDQANEEPSDQENADLVSTPEDEASKKPRKKRNSKPKNEDGVQASSAQSEAKLDDNSDRLSSDSAPDFLKAIND